MLQFSFHLFWNPVKNECHPRPFVIYQNLSIQLIISQHDYQINSFYLRWLPIWNSSLSRITSNFYNYITVSSILLVFPEVPVYIHATKTFTVVTQILWIVNIKWFELCVRVEIGTAVKLAKLFEWGRCSLFLVLLLCINLEKFLSHSFTKYCSSVWKYLHHGFHS